MILALAGTSIEHVEQLGVQETTLRYSWSVSSARLRPSHLDELGLAEAAVTILVESLEYLDSSLPPLLLGVALPSQFYKIIISFYLQARIMKSP